MGVDDGVHVLEVAFDGGVGGGDGGLVGACEFEPLVVVVVFGVCFAVAVEFFSEEFEAVLGADVFDSDDECAAAEEEWAEADVVECLFGEDFGFGVGEGDHDEVAFDGLVHFCAVDAAFAVAEEFVAVFDVVVWYFVEFVDEDDFVVGVGECAEFAGAEVADQA